MNFIVQHLESTFYFPNIENTYPYKLNPNYGYGSTCKHIKYKLLAENKQI